MLSESAVLAEIARIKASEHLPEPPPIPKAPDLYAKSNMEQKLAAIQKYLQEFQYNYSGKPFFKLNQRGDISHVKKMARELMSAGLPIQCVEAVFISFLLTADFTEIERIPLSFKSQYNGNYFRHMVLAVRLADGRWGSLGMSRRDCLMYKPPNYRSLEELVEEFRRSYTTVLHRLVSVYVGVPFPHSNSRNQWVNWKVLKVKIGRSRAKQTVPSTCTEHSDSSCKNCIDSSVNEGLDNSSANNIDSNHNNCHTSADSSDFKENSEFQEFKVIKKGINREIIEVTKRSTNQLFDSRDESSKDTKTGLIEVLPSSAPKFITYPRSGSSFVDKKKEMVRVKLEQYCNNMHKLKNCYAEQRTSAIVKR